jgi:hypothetical protein
LFVQSQNNIKEEKEENEKFLLNAKIILRSSKYFELQKPYYDIGNF